MKVFIDWASLLREEGRLTLQVPQFYLGCSDEWFVEAPDEWFFEIKCEGISSRLAVGREQGFTYISPKGYADNREAIIKAWMSICHERGFVRDEATFDAHAAEFYAEVERVSLLVSRRGSCPQARAKSLQEGVQRYFKGGFYLGGTTVIEVQGGSCVPFSGATMMPNVDRYFDRMHDDYCRAADAANPELEEIETEYVEIVDSDHAPLLDEDWENESYCALFVELDDMLEGMYDQHLYHLSVLEGGR